MNSIRRILAALAGILLALAAAPAAFALPPHGGGSGGGAQPPVQVIADGMPGWQITLIAAGAALAGAAVAILLHRAQMARKAHATTG